MRGFTPHPSRDIVPAPNSGNNNSFQTINFPVKQSTTHTHFHKRTNETLRIGCPHCGPRAGRCETPPAGCCASGENEKKPAGKRTFLTGFFLHFHCARGLSFRFPKFHAERRRGKKSSSSQNGCRGNPPAVGVQGARSPLLCRFSLSMRKEVWKNSLPHRRMGPGAMPLVRGPHRPLPHRSPKQHAERRMEKQTSASQDGCRGNPPAEEPLLRHTRKRISFLTVRFVV